MHDELDQQKMLDLMQTEFAFVQRTLLLVPAHLMEQPNVQGKWSVKDTVAHLSAWHKRTLRWIEMARRGEGVQGQHVTEPEPGFGWHEKDAINEKSYQEDKDRPMDEIFAEFRDTFNQLYAETATSSDGELFGREGLSSFFRDPLYGYIIWNTYEHYKEHIPPIRAWLRDGMKE